MPSETSNQIQISSVASLSKYVSFSPDTGYKKTLEKDGPVSEKSRHTENVPVVKPLEALWYLWNDPIKYKFLMQCGSAPIYGYAELEK